MPWVADRHPAKVINLGGGNVASVRRDVHLVPKHAPGAHHTYSQRVGREWLKHAGFTLRPVVHHYIDEQ